jgi:PAX-interacting protein 1
MQQDDEMPHQLNEVNDVKMTQGIEHETALNQRPEVKNLKFRQVAAVKSGVPPSIASPRHIQTEPVQLPRHFPLTNQHNMLRSQTIVGSPSHSVNSQPGFSAKFLSNDSSYLNTGKTEHEPVTDVVESITRFATGTADVPTSHQQKM